MHSLIKNKLLELPRLLKRLLVIILDGVLAILAVWFAYYLRIGSFLPLWETSNEHILPNAWLLAIATSIPIFSVLGLYNVIFRYSGGRVILSIAKAVVAYAFVYSIVVLIIGVEGVPRTIGIIQPIVLFIFMAISRGGARFWLGEVYENKQRKDSRVDALIYGAGPAGRELATAVSRGNEISIIGFLDDDPQLQGIKIDGYSIYAFSDLDTLVKKTKVSRVILALPSVSLNNQKEIVNRLAEYPLTVQVMPSLSDLSKGRVSINEFKDISIEDILERDTVSPDQQLMNTDIVGKTVLVTGAGGSIGSELSFQILSQKPEKIILFEQNEFALFNILNILEKFNKMNATQSTLVPILGSVTDETRIHNLLLSFSIDTIYHAAAYKHVALVENNVCEGLFNNLFGTLVIAKLAVEVGVKKFVLVSTDKAVRPTNIMGATKRLAEMCLQALSTTKHGTIFSIVRFGNVLNSSGSVVPIFNEQIKAGGPVTVTHKNVTRYFMTISEAASLVIQAGALTDKTSMFKGSAPIYLLDMGAPVKIYDLAVKMINLSGSRPIHPGRNNEGDIEIKITGLKPGEKLNEELLIAEDCKPTLHPKIRVANEDFIPWEVFSQKIEELRELVLSNNTDAIKTEFVKLVEGYSQ